jgi:hypothetical protein
MSDVHAAPPVGTHDVGMTRPPLVYATSAAVEQACRVLPAGECVEQAVARLAACGRVTRYRYDGLCTKGTPDRWANGDGWSARVTRSCGRLDPSRSAWLVVEVVAR